MIWSGAAYGRHVERTGLMAARRRSCFLASAMAAIRLVRAARWRQHARCTRPPAGAAGVEEWPVRTADRRISGGRHRDDCRPEAAARRPGRAAKPLRNAGESPHRRRSQIGWRHRFPPLAGAGVGRISSMLGRRQHVGRNCGVDGMNAICPGHDRCGQARAARSRVLRLGCAGQITARRFHGVTPSVGGFVHSL